ncbi:keratin, type I cytoskeletal 10 [Bactrocera oleae]|uniref:keratin, type I cytoskeletal 10 n=1 Tax=Bactrocera oleae TaxID=104688 RepID=UPI00387E98E9
MRGTSIVFLAFLAYSSAYPLEEQQVSVQVPESALHVNAEKDAVLPEVSEIVQIIAVPESEADQSKAQQLLDVDVGVPAGIEATRQARQFLGGFGGGFPGNGGFGGGGFPGYGGFGGFPGYGGNGGYGGFGGHRHHGGFGRYPGYGGYGGFYG